MQAAGEEGASLVVVGLVGATKWILEVMVILRQLLRQSRPHMSPYCCSTGPEGKDNLSMEHHTCQQVHQDQFHMSLWLDSTSAAQ